MSAILLKLRTVLTRAAKGKQAQHAVHTVLFVARNGSPHAQWLSSTCTLYRTASAGQKSRCRTGFTAEIKVSAGCSPFWKSDPFSSQVVVAL